MPSGRFELTKETVFFWVIVLMIVLYGLPLVYIAHIYLDNISLETPLDPDAPGVEWFLGFARGQEKTLDVLQRILLPLVTFIAAASFATAASTWRTLGVSLLLVFFIVLTLVMGNIFDTEPQLHAAGVSPYFDRMQETLITYLVLILGLKSATLVGQARPASGGAATPAADRGG
jgi:hypothetical protein